MSKFAERFKQIKNKYGFTLHGELDFTVPEFDGFIKRLGEYEEWKR